MLAVDLAVAMAGALVIVDTVVIVQAMFGLGQQSTAVAFAVFGGGSMVAALVLPDLLGRFSDRTVMLSGGGALSIGTLAAATLSSFAWLLPLWFLLGLGYAAAQVPTGRLLRRSASPDDRPALFAAQFALSHACWLIAYPLAGWSVSLHSLPVTASILAVSAASAIVAALILWPSEDPEAIEHDHADLPPGHPHLAAVGHGRRHTHDYVIDDLHATWPHARR